MHAANDLPHPQRCGSVEAWMVRTWRLPVATFHTLKGVAPLKLRSWCAMRLRVRSLPHPQRCGSVEARCEPGRSALGCGLPHPQRCGSVEAFS